MATLNEDWTKQRSAEMCLAPAGMFEPKHVYKK